MKPYVLKEKILKYKSQWFLWKTGCISANLSIQNCTIKCDKQYHNNRNEIFVNHEFHTSKRKMKIQYYVENIQITEIFTHDEWKKNR